MFIIVTQDTRQWSINVFRTLSNIRDGPFYQNSYLLKTVYSFHKKLHLRCLTGFSIRLWWSSVGLAIINSEHWPSAFIIRCELTLACCWVPNSNGPKIIFGRYSPISYRSYLWSSMKTSAVFEGVSKANIGRKWVIKLLYFTTSYKIVIIKFLESLHNLPFHDRADVDASISFLISLSNNADAKEVDFVWKRNKTCSKF